MKRRNLFTKWATELLCSEKEGGFSMAVKLITGLKEAQDIQSEDDGARIYGTISSEDRVLDVGEKFAYQIITNNCVRIKSGEILMQGRHMRNLCKFPVLDVYDARPSYTSNTGNLHRFGN